MFAITLTAEEFACLQQYRPEILDVLKSSPSSGEETITYSLVRDQVRKIALISKSKQTIGVWNQFPYSLRLKLYKLHRKHEYDSCKRSGDAWPYYIKKKHGVSVNHELTILNEPT